MIDRLDNVSLAIGIIAKVLFFRVCFFNASPKFQTPRFRNLASKIGICQIDYAQLDNVSAAGGHELQFQLDQRVLEKELKNSYFYHWFIQHFRLDTRGVEKLDCVLRSRLLKHCLEEGTQAVNLARHTLLAKNRKIIYMPAQISNYLLIKGLEDMSISTVGWHCSVNEIMLMGRKVARIPYRILKGIFLFVTQIRISQATRNHSRIATSPPILGDMSYYHVAFFPHKGIRYGPFFQKTYLYGSDPTDPLYKKKVLTLFHGETDKVSARYLRMCKIPYGDVTSFGSNNYKKKAFNRFFAKSHKKRMVWDLLLSQGVLGSIFLIRLLRDFIDALSDLENLSSLKVVYIHYDTLFPQEFLLACHIKSIETISTQERTFQYNFLGNLCYYHYLTAGHAFQQKLKSSHFACGNYFAIGSPRSTYINEPQNMYRYQKYIDIKQNYTLAVCYGLLPVSKFETGIYGQTGTSEQSNLDLLKTVKRLADSFPSLYIVLRFKSTSHLNDALFAKAVQSLNEMPNAEVAINLSEHNSYAMAHLADIVLGKQTNILEEAFAAGKPVIYYDNEGWVRARDFVLKDIGLVAADYNELHLKIKLFMSNAPYYNETKGNSVLKNYYLGEDNDQNGFHQLRKYVTEVYERKMQTSHEY